MRKSKCLTLVNNKNLKLVYLRDLWEANTLISIIVYMIDNKLYINVMYSQHDKVGC